MLKKISPKTKMLAGLAMIGSLFLVGCAEEEVVKTAPPRTVKSLVITVDSGTYEQSFSGRLHSTSEVNFSFRVPGTIESLPVNKGDFISAGTVLATLDPTDYELQVEKSQAALAESEANLRNATGKYDRVKKLYEAGNTSRNDLDNARAQFDTAKASVQASRKAMEIARRDLSYTTLKADDDCGIAEVNPDVGENVGSGEQVIFATCGDGLEVKLNIPETVISFIENGMTVDVTFPAIEGQVFAGKVTEVGVSSIGGSTTFPVDVLIEDPNADQLKAGLSADVIFAISLSDTEVVLVPPFAVGEDDQGRFVYVLTSQENGLSTVHRTPVTIGNAVQDGLEITSGLKPGMRIVTAGVSALRDGMEVKSSAE